MSLHVQLHGGGRPLVVLPSFGLDHAAMAETIEPVIADHLGWCRLYGSPSGDPRSDVVLDNVVGVIGEDPGDKRFAIAGWSYGGYLTTGVARRLPRQVAGLMMICSGFKIRPEDRDLTGVLDSDPEPGRMCRGTFTITSPTPWVAKPLKSPGESQAP
jgi:pimeloyl-ACP methyl ester carboxylesterase